jgi:hypothetical protein
MRCALLVLASAAFFAWRETRGWKDSKTILTSYQRTDEQSMLRDGGARKADESGN